MGADYSIIEVTNGYQVCKECLGKCQLVIFVETYEHAMDLVIKLSVHSAQLGE